MNYYDAHNHLQDERLAGDPAGVVARARAAGVARMAVNGTSPSDWAEVERLAGRFPEVTPCYGLHPWYVDARGEGWLENLASRLGDPRSAVGEIGLDCVLESRDDAAMEQAFRAQLALSRDLRRPVTIHCRRAWGRLMDVLREAGPHPAGMIVHSYGGGPEQVAPLAALNAYFSFSGSVTHPNNKRGRAAATLVPADRLLIETDAPDIPPEGWPAGAPHEPASLVRIAETVAALRGMSVVDLAALTFGNAQRLFG